MRSLDYAFCLKVGDAVSPLCNLHAFCLALESVFSTHFPDARCQIWLKENERSNQWEKLADLSKYHRQIHIPTEASHNGDIHLLNELLSTNNTLSNSDGFHFLLPLYGRGAMFGAIVVSSPLKINVDVNSQKILAYILAGALDNHLQHQSLLSEKQAHENTSKELQKEVNSQKGLLEQLQILHKISRRLWHSHSQDNMLHTAVYECIHALDIDRMAIFLYNKHTAMIRGTYGTDINGIVSNEQWYCAAIDDHTNAKNTLDKRKNITIYKDTPLFHNNEIVGRGWNTTISLWDGDDPIGWIACDNLLTQTPLKSYHRELLKLLGITMSQHLTQRRSQDALKSLNVSLEQRVAKRTAQLEEANKRLNFISREDSLTKVPNRRMLDEKLEEEWRRALRHKTSLTLLIVDIDHFKQYNDTYGHALGDKCLSKVAKALSRVERRAGALLARFGGEEFVFLLPCCDPESAKIVAQRALKAVSSLHIMHENSPIAPYVTISIGGKSMIPQSVNNRQQLFVDADVALYKAKSKGKNQAFLL